MMERRDKTNSKINWMGCCKIPKVKSYFLNDEPQYVTAMHNSTETVEESRKHWFDMMRRFLDDVYQLAEDQSLCNGDYKMLNIFKKYDVYALDIDDIKRININEPEGYNAKNI